MTIQELRQRRAKLVADARAILNTADAAKRELSAEESANYDALMKQVTDLGDDIGRRERLEAIETEQRQSAHEPMRQPIGTPGAPALDSRATDQYRAAYRHWLAGGADVLNAAESRALQADNGTLGGYLIPPMQFVKDLIAAKDNAVFIRRLATVQTVTSSDSLGAPSLDTDPADADWTSEIGTRQEDSSMAFGRREMKPQLIAKLVKVSEKLLNRVPNAEQVVRDRLAYKFGITEEKAFMTGTGASKPLGVFTASADGVTTARDYSTDNTTTTITFDNLKGVKYSLKGAYHPNASWVFHRDAVAMISKLKDGDGQYIWQSDVKAGEPDRILGFPVYMSEYAPNTFTTGLYVGILGDFKAGYWIADYAEGYRTKRLVELYAATGQIGILGEQYVDGAPVLAEAFARVKLA